MQVQRTRAWIGRIVIPALLATTVVAGDQTPRPIQQTPIFRATTDHVATQVIVRDNSGRFVPNLRTDEFQIFEDGVPQKLTTFVVSVGGRVLTEITPTTVAPRSEGLILPRTAALPDQSGRIFIIFIDDMHLQALDSPMVRNVLQKIRDTVIHEGDLIGLVSTGYSSIEVDLNYDYKHRRFNEAIGKVMGSGMTPADIISANNTAEGPAGIRHNTHVAFSTAYDVLGQLEKVTNRRKAFIYVSNGYDFNPFKDSRYKYEQDRYAAPRDETGTGETGTGSGSSSDTSYNNPFEKTQQFAETDLISDVAELVRAARRANVTFYTLDPRGLNAGPDIGSNLSMEEWRRHVDTSISTLKVLGDETGGFCICNTNDFVKGLQRIDNEMSDYYMIGYTSNNPDPLKVRRRIEIKITRPGLQRPIYKEQYELKRPSKKG